MKILIISDSHGHIANLKTVLDIGKKANIKAVIHCGDWNTLEAVETVLSSKIPLYTVLGNADIRPEVRKSLEINSKKFGKDFLKFEIGGRKIGITHKPSDIKKFFKEGVDIIFCGHKHSKDESRVGEIDIVRPGAIINGINFAVFDTEKNKIEFIEDEQ